MSAVSWAFSARRAPSASRPPFATTPTPSWRPLRRPQRRRAQGRGRRTRSSAASLPVENSLEGAVMREHRRDPARGASEHLRRGRAARRALPHRRARHAASRTSTSLCHIRRPWPVPRLPRRAGAGAAAAVRSGVLHRRRRRGGRADADAAAIGSRARRSCTAATSSPPPSQDVRNNKTRFVVARPDGRRADRRRQDVDGLHDAARPARHAYRGPAGAAEPRHQPDAIESRPSRQDLGVYVFLIDFQGHRLDAEVAEALEAVEEHSELLPPAGVLPALRRTCNRPHYRFQANPPGVADATIDRRAYGPSRQTHPPADTTTKRRRPIAGVRASSPSPAQTTTSSTIAVPRPPAGEPGRLRARDRRRQSTAG